MTKALSAGEEGFLLQLKALKLPLPDREYQFDEKRKYRFDFAWPDPQVAVEIEGGVMSFGRHVRGRGYEEDCRKYNLAASQGWIIYRFTGRMVKSGEAISFIEQVIR